MVVAFAIDKQADAVYADTTRVVLVGLVYAPSAKSRRASVEPVLFRWTWVRARC